jgi:hypothetical protein
MADFHNAGTGNGAGGQGYVSGPASSGAPGQGAGYQQAPGTWSNYSFNAYSQSGAAGYDSWVEPEAPEEDAAEPGSVSAGLPPQWGKALSVAGAVASIALIVGVGVWGYKLVARDVSGVPVVRAIEGPMRVQPVDPGGKPADHQGLAVNAVAAKGTASAPADRLVLAPQAVSLSDEDQPVAAGAAQPQLAAAEPIAQPEALSEEAVTDFQDGEVAALVEELTRGVPSLLDEESEPTPAAAPAIVQPEPLKPVVAAVAKAEVKPAVIAGPGVARSLRPIARPARVASRENVVQAALSTAADASASLDIDPATLPAGTRLAQLGAFESVAVAQAEWERLNGRFGDYLTGKKRVIQKASSGGRTFYRLRAMGFADLSDARRFCSALVAGNADCIPVTTR